jgi:ERCC4-type nuclease
MSHFEVVFDHREEPGGVPTALGDLGISVRRVTLPAGDYAIGRQTLIERKTVRDLHISVATRRFWGQLNRLRSSCAHPIVLVEGDDLDAGPLTSDGIRGVIVALCDRGVPVLRSRDPRDSAAWIHSIARSRSSNKRVRITPPYRRPSRVRDPVGVEVLRAIPGITLSNARNLLACFGTVRAIADAPLAELQAVAGIGAARSSAIRDALAGGPMSSSPDPAPPDQGRAT